MKSRVVLLVTFVQIAASALTSADVDTDGIAEYRTIDGSGNSMANPAAGMAETPLIRVAPAGYGDGTNLSRGVPAEDEGDGHIETDEQTLPSARLISNLVHDQDSDGGRLIYSSRKLNQLFFQFGQFIDHDIGLSEPNTGVVTGGGTGLAGNEMFFIEVPGGDPDFAVPEIPLLRAVAEAAGSSPTGRREQINTITAFIDGSHIYGSDDSRSANLRTFVGGRVLTQPGIDGDLPPFNTFGEENANPLGLPDATLFLAGDVRANEQVGLTALHTVFLREHNRLAAVIAESDFSRADLSNVAVDEEIFQRTRAAVSAIMQNITYSEWLPALFGKDRLGGYMGYLPGVNSQLANVFSGAAFRIGHTMLPPKLYLTQANGTFSPLSLRNAFFQPAVVSANGIDPILRGLSGNLQQEIDRFVVDDVRNFLFPAGGGELDLAAVNIQRGRDHGLPGFNDVRQAFGLPRVQDYDDITPDAQAQAALAAAYGAGNVDDVDLWTGGITEEPIPGTGFGETFTAILVDQFLRLRDGDRFFFLNANIYSPAFIRDVRATTLADVILRNTGLSAAEVNNYAFFQPGFHPFQPDMRNGPRSNPVGHKGNDIYTGGDARQKFIKKTGRRRAHFCLSVENDGMMASHFQMHLRVAAKRKFRTQVFETSGTAAATNISASIFNGFYSRPYQPGEMRVLRSVVRKRGKSDRKQVARLRFRVQAVGQASGSDVNRARLVFE